MVIDDLKHKSIFLDTAPLIYFIEGHSEYQNSLKEIFAANDKGELKFITSSITLLEVLVKPLKAGESKLADQYKKVLTSAKGIEIVDITVDIAVKAAELRAKYNLRTPDSIQVATAVEYKTDHFLTNDMRLMAVLEAKVITLPDLR